VFGLHTTLGRPPLKKGGGWQISAKAIKLSSQIEETEEKRIAEKRSKRAESELSN